MNIIAIRNIIVIGNIINIIAIRYKVAKVVKVLPQWTHTKKSIALAR